MSSTERAPEPTMEEILASIRRIISDDEQNAPRQRPASARQQDDESVEASEGEADDRIINDIARVLSASAPKVEDEEDILDLTAELGGSEIFEEVLVEEVLVEEVLVEEVAAPLEMQPEAIVLPEPPQAETMVAETPQAEAQVSEPQRPLSASEEAASALERAIAALRAGQLPTSVGEFMPQPEPVPQPQAFSPQPEPVPQPQAFSPVPEPAPEREPFAFAPMPELVAEPEPLPEPQPDLGLPEFAAEPMLEETVVIETPFETEPEENERVETAPEESARHESVAAPVEPLPWARKNGGSHGAPPLDASPKSLEDSVKDMLRPMLKQWLDENMARVLTAALKEELGERGGIRQGD
ncbi:MAG TPA: DUF2497 domain-containing protein [Methyloceanibacter sp.]|nr:DUF2497 domain-containing protein [Methyloceanibacter sp.]